MTTDNKLLDRKLTYIALKDLVVVWPDAQRIFNPKWAKEIADNFDPEKFEPPTVTKPNGAGTYHISEGQHRVRAAEMWLGDPSQRIGCLVSSEDFPTAERAAELWLGINGGRKKPSPVRRFIISVTAKRDLEVSINNLVRQKGYHVVERSGENCIQAVGALYRVYRMSPKTLASTLDATRLLWGGDPHAVAGDILKGLGVFLNEYQDYVDPRRLRATIVDKYKSPWRFIEAATAEKEKTLETLEHAMSELIRMQYNRGLKDPSKKLKRKE